MPGPMVFVKKSDAQLCVSNKKNFSSVVDFAQSQRTTTMVFEDKLLSKQLFSLGKYMSSTCFQQFMSKKRRFDVNLCPKKKGTANRGHRD